ncbi:general transcription factor II-I repeat domain-containing protein 2A [Trichonephila clavipes]|nr:general transcription factor II-I repeat domain-containing protein 2A [Trichonephila clavipes]
MEELLGMFPMKGQTSGSELLSSLIHLCDAASLNMNNCVDITTDGAKSMIGTKIGMVTLLKELLAHCSIELLQLHCIIHQENLCGKELGFSTLMQCLSEAINFIHSNALKHRQFKEFLKDFVDLPSDILYYTEVGWLSRGVALKCLMELFDEIVTFLSDCGKNTRRLKEGSFQCDLAFLTDITGHLNDLNTKPHGKNHFIFRLINNPSVTAGALDLQTTRDSENSSLNALKQAYMTNAILSTMKPNEMDLKIMSQFPELLSVIQQNPSIISAAAQLQCKDSNLYKMCNSSFQAVLNLAKDASPENNSHFPETSLTDKKQPLLNAKKRRERYSPEFKLTVIEYAASHSYQETSRKFGVHHITVSEWCKDKERIRKKVYCENLQSLHTKILKSETAEQKFLSWIQDCNKQKIVIKPSDVQNKASEILSIIGEAEVKKNCWWFYLWNKRGMDTEKIYEEEADVDVLEKESRVNYPPAVKVEIAKVAERQSVNCAARCFRVARKRIREWVKCKDKLKWLAETGQVRERGGSLGGKKINCLDVDKEVYDWYSSSRTPENAPQLSEIRTKALEIFQKHGFSNMKCSKEWYKNWCKRYGICRSLQKDNQLIRWILSRYDKNLPITNQELVEYAISERMKTGVSLNDLPAEEYVFSFCKRYPRLLEALPSIGETFPEEMEAEVTKFRVMIKELQEENNFSTLAIGCMDEIPFLFTNSGSERRVIINSGMSSWNALVILSCLADGTLLPPMIVLKGPEDTLPPEGLKHVVFREKLLADQYVMSKWVNDVWLGNVPSPSMLLMDCFEPHTCSPVQDTMLESGITPVVMPEGCASKLQPLGVCIARNFQESIQDIWSSSRNIAEDYSKMAAGTYPGEIAQCIAAAFERFKDRRDVVRRSFVVTGIAVAPDGSEDALIENADWFGCSGDEHVLSPASESDRDSDLDAS